METNYSSIWLFSFTGYSYCQGDGEHHGGLCDVKFKGGDDFGHSIYEYGWSDNLRGFISYRHLIENM